MNICICKIFVMCHFLTILQKRENLQNDFCNKLLQIYNLCVIVIIYTLFQTATLQFCLVQLLLIRYMHPQLSLTEYGSMINLWSVFLGHISCAGLDVYYWTVQYCPTTYSLSPYNLVNGFTRTG